jgi:hypothetical protein
MQFQTFIYIYKGTEIIPSPVEEFHVFLVSDSSVGVAWDPPTGGYNVTQYQVFYQFQNPAGSSVSKPSDLKSVSIRM